MDDRYDREERRPDRGSWGGSGQQDAPASGDFPWQGGSGSDPGAGWGPPEGDSGSHPPPQAPAGQGGGPAAPPGNGLAVAGFVLSILALILCWLSLIDLIFVIPAIVFSAIGLGRANKQGRPHRGLAIAGLSISLVAAVIMIVLTIIYARVVDDITDELQRIDSIDRLDSINSIEELNDAELNELDRRCTAYYSSSDEYDPELEHWCEELLDRYEDSYDFDF